MRFKSVLAIVGLIATTFFVTPLLAGPATDLETVLAPASKLCLIANLPKLSSGFISARAVEKSFDLLSCFPKDSPQARGYALLARMLYSPDYGTVIASLRGKNAGLVSYFTQRLRSDDGFFAAARGFYDEINQIDLNFFTAKHPELIGKIPNLAQVAGEGKFADVVPGWLWELALKHGRRPAVAMALIGICGHDDVHDLPFSNARGDAQFSCPMRGMTLFYVAGGLGRTVDLDSLAKARIAAVQAPNLGPRALPSKSYHVYGGALFACTLKDQGLSAAEIEAVTGLITRLYRVTDMRNRILINKAYASEDRAALERDLRESCRTEKGRFLCPSPRTPNGYDQAREDRFVAGKLTEFDSYFLIDRWGMIKNLPILGLPLDLDLTVSAAQEKDRPPGWTTVRFERALRRLETYATDVEWSQLQHRAGARFALERCGAAQF